jgi:homoserine O-succinyltransferase
VPHSRYNEVSRGQFEQAGLTVLVDSDEAGVHLAVSEDGFRVVYFQGHPEYDTISLLKEYKREILRFFAAERDDYPPVPQHYMSQQVHAIMDEYHDKVLSAKARKAQLPVFPEEFVWGSIDNTWRDTAEAVLNNWVGRIYHLTNQDRKLPFMEGVNPADPLGLKK